MTQFIISLFLIITISLKSQGHESLIQKGDTIVFLGGTHIVNEMKKGVMEASIYTKFKDYNLIFRDFSWEGDTVYHLSTVRERWRKEAFGDLQAQLKKVNANVIIAQFGAMESFDGLEKMYEFKNAYKEIISGLLKHDLRVIISEPAPLAWSNASSNNYLEYKDTVKKLAKNMGVPYLENSVAESIGEVPPEWLVEAVKVKNRLWYEYWRPSNWKCLFGDDRKRIFSNAADGLPSFKQEWSQYEELIKSAEYDIQNGKIPQPVRNPKLTGSGEANIKEELSSFKILDGLEVNLFANESMGIANPLSVRWDAQGRMYVACSDTYPQVRPGAIANDRIIRLVDSNDDGIADSHEVFADGLNIPTGMEVGHDGVYVGQNTELIHIDWDGNNRVVLSGFGNGDSHQTINSFAWSPCGDLLFCQGDGIESRVETPHGISSLFQAGVFRLSPDTLKLDGLLDDFMGPGNPWGVAFNDYGQSFVIDGAGGVSFLTPGSIPVKHKLKLPRIGKPGGYCGIDVIGSTSLPDSMQGDLVIGDYKKNQISRFHLEEEGAGYRVVWKEPLIKSSHRNFRPVDVKLGPDGAVYVVDWYNPITCHQDDFYRHPNRDMTHGRIWRVSKVNGNHGKSDLYRWGNKRLFESLKSDNRWIRFKAKQVLSSRNLQSIPSFVFKYEGRDLIELASLVDMLQLANKDLIYKMMQSGDHRVRAYGARMIGQWYDEISDSINLLMAAASDGHPLVKMESILSASKIPNAESILVVARALNEAPDDKWVEYAAIQATHFLKPYWLPSFINGNLTLPQGGREISAILAIAGEKNVSSNLKQILASSQLSHRRRSRLISVLLSIGDSRDIKWAFESQNFDSDNIQSLIKLNKPDFEVHHSVSQWLKSQDHSIKNSAIQLAGAWRLPGTSALLQKHAVSTELPIDTRAMALQNIGKIGGDNIVDFYQSFLHKHGNNRKLYLSAIEGLIYQDVKVASHFTGKFLKSQLDNQSAQFLYKVFLGSEMTRKEFIRLLNGIGPELSQKKREILRNAWFSSSLKDKVIQELLDNLSGVNIGELKYSSKAVKRYAKLAKKGSVKPGEMVFRSAKAGCSSCHKVGNHGGVLGPDLSQAGSVIPKERIVTEVMWPSLHVKEGYTLSSVTLKSGRIVQGYEQASRNSDVIVIREIAQDSQMTIARDNVDSVVNLGSLMPATAKSLPNDQLADLFAYLFHLGGI